MVCPIGREWTAGGLTDAHGGPPARRVDPLTIRTPRTVPERRPTPLSAQHGITPGPRLRARLTGVRDRPIITAPNRGPAAQYRRCRAPLALDIAGARLPGRATTRAGLSPCRAANRAVTRWPGRRPRGCYERRYGAPRRHGGPRVVRDRAPTRARRARRGMLHGDSRVGPSSCERARAFGRAVDGG
jgi:hypothetical protein